MQLQGPVFVIDEIPYRIVIQPADLSDLCIAVRHAMQATELDPAKLDQVHANHGPFAFTFRAVVRNDVQPHWVGVMRYADQEMMLFRIGDAGSLVELHRLLQDNHTPAEIAEAAKRDTCACCGGSAWLSEITLCENCYEDRLS